MSTKIYFGFIKSLSATSPCQQRTIIDIKDRNISSPHRKKTRQAGAADQTAPIMDHIATGDHDNTLFWVCQAIVGGQPAPIKNHFEPFWTHQAAAGDHYARPSLGEEPFWVDQIIAMRIKYLLFDFPASPFRAWDLSTKFIDKISFYVYQASHYG